MAPFKFGDAAGANAQYIPYEYAALYSADCDYPTPPEVAARWDRGHRRYFTFRGDPECSMVDFEKYVALFTDEVAYREWLTDRANSESLRRAWVYSDLANAEKAARWALGLPFMWNVADWSGTPKSRQELRNLLLEWNVPSDQCEISQIAAQQYNDGQIGPPVQYDSNICWAGW